MNPTNILTHNLNDFLEELRFAGYNIGTAQFLAAQRLLLVLIEQNALPTKPDKLCILLGPILCRSPKEQDDFKGYFYDWIDRAADPKLKLWTPNNKHLGIQSFSFGSVLRCLRWQWLVPVIVTVLMGILVYYGVDILEFTLQSVTTPLPDIQSLQSGGLLWGAVVILLLGLAWYFMPWKSWRQRWVQRYLSRKAVTQYPNLKNLSVTLAEKSIFQPLKSTAQQLRKHINIPSLRLDVKATVEKTIEAANCFTPVTGTMKTRPEYLALIDRTSFHDHQAALVTVLIKDLLNEGVFVVPYYFDGEPRRCYAPSQFAFLNKGGHRLEMIQKGEYTVVTLPELVARYPEHHLMIFADGQHFIDRTTGQVADWVKQLYDWSQRSLFTLANPNEWGYRERILADDFLVMPANEAGLRALVEQIHSGSKAEALDSNSKAEALDSNTKVSNFRFPQLLYERSHRWIEPRVPEAEILADLLSQLKKFLGKKGYYWFSACAVYPELRWQLTLYLGDTLSCAIEKNLGKLARLLWFREGYIPDWLREPLVADLLPKQREDIQTALEELLLSATGKPETDFQLQIATDVPKAVKRKDTPLKEYVFVTFFGDNLAVKLSHPLSLFSEKLTKLDKKPETAKSQLKTFAFEVVTVDKKGEIVIRSQKQAKYYTETLSESVTLDMVSIPGGTFLMGSPETEIDRYDDESPQHKVTIQPFFMSKYLVTQTQWQAIMGKNPSRFKGKNLPVERVSWDDAMAFCKKLSKKTGNTYRLPSESEWEYACRAGTTTPFYFGETITTDLANYRGIDDKEYKWSGSYGSGPKGIYREKTTDVGSFPSNAFGLCDMHGNLWEWVADKYHESYNGSPSDNSVWEKGGEDYRVLRGGSWSYYPDDSRAANRIGSNPGNRNLINGFRVVRRVAWT